MIMLLNLCRLFMVVWIIYALILLFAPHVVHRTPDPTAAAIQALVAFALGYLMDRVIGVLRRRKAMRMAATPTSTTGAV
ncbi:MAG TPA: hypothetical protein VHY75_03765 [Steroidobacteraceae bacterium]|jgi:uncharacterized membrane-anchored protein|nr:hypothetical protein [Steroidobacteraceae bacterium]